MGKRGQLTLFIIIGLLVVLLVGIVIFVNVQRAPIAGLPQVQEVAEQAKPVQNFIQSCLYLTAQQGLERIGDTGGYLSLNEVPGIKINPVEVTESDALMFSPRGRFGIPYWYYMSSKNTCVGNCEFSSKKPNLFKRQGEPSIEGQLERYIEANVETCLKDFDVLAQQGIEVTAENQGDVEVFVTKNDVVIGLFREYTVISEGGRHTLDEFVAPVDVRLQDIYELAENITVLEAENGFLAKHARNIISAFSRADAEAIPPIGDMDLSLGGGEIWPKITVQQRIQELLQSHVQLLQVFGTKNYRPIEAPANIQNPETIENMLNRDSLIPVLRVFPHTEARFAYIGAWKPYFDLNCDGAVCKPEGFLNTFLFPFGIQKYDFAYDLSYPVLVELREPDAFNGQGYTFRFALEGNMRNNEPVTVDWEEFSPIEPQDLFSQLCNENHKTSGFVNITITNSVSLEPVDAAITYSCGAEECIIGRTVDGRLNTRLPRCIGGQLRAGQIDYAPLGINLDTSTDDDQILDLEMHPIVPFNVTAIKYRLKKDSVTRNWKLDTNPVFFTPHDQATISLSRIPEAGEEPFASFASVCGTPFIVSGQELDKDVPLTVGNYNVQITSLYHDTIVVPSETRCYGGEDILGIEVEKEECFAVPNEPMYFGNATGNPCTSERPFISGALQFNWEITPEMLRNNIVVFKTITVAAELLENNTLGGSGTYLTIEDLSQITATQDYAVANPGLIAPEVRR